MGKRLERYYQPALLVQLPNVVGKNISIVMQDDRVHDGTLLSSGENIILKDKLGRKHILPSTQIMELLLDFESAY